MMTEILTIGANGKSPKKFFKILKDAKVDLVLDIRLNNKSQLAGFAKGGDDYLGYLLSLVNINYIYDPYFAPTKSILDKYHEDNNWNTYVKSFNQLILKKNFRRYFKEKYGSFKRVCFLCAEETDEKCHRRLVAESIVENEESIIHL